MRFDQRWKISSFTLSENNEMTLVIIIFYAFSVFILVALHKMEDSVITTTPILSYPKIIIVYSQCLDDLCKQ